MKHLGDFAVGTTIYGKFTTVAASTGAPTQLAGSPVLSVYKDDSTTQLVGSGSPTFMSLTVDFDSVTGLNHFTIDTSVEPGFFTSGSFFEIVITTGTVGGTSVVGYCVASFTLEKTAALRPTVAGRTLDVSSGGEAGVDWANVGSPTTTVTLSGTTVKTATDVETDTADIQSRLPAALVSGRIDASVGAMAANTLTASALATDAVTEIQSGLATQASVDVIDGIVDSILVDTAEIGAAGAGLTALASAANLATVAGYLDTEIAAILADTNELQTDWANGGRLDLLIDGIKATTDKLDTAVQVYAGSPTEATYQFTAHALELAPTGGSAPSAAAIADAVWDEARAGHVSAGSFGEGVASVQGNVTGSVASVATGGIAAASFAAGAIDAAAIAANAIDASALATDAVTEIQSGLATQASVDVIDGIVDAILVDTAEIGAAGAGLTALASAANLATVAGYLDTEIVAIKTVTDKLDTTLTSDLGSPGVYQFTADALDQAPAGGGSAPSAADIADAVWDEAIAGHLTAGSTGNALNNATAAGNPWAAVIEGSYTAEDILRVIAAFAAGKTSIVTTGSGQAIVVFRDITDASDIITANVTNSERASVTLAP